MKLNEWLKEKNMSVSHFALCVGAHRATVYLWLTHKFIPNRFYIRHIEKFTKGKVKREDFQCST